jgi:hypothetical protein
MLRGFPVMVMLASGGPAPARPRNPHNNFYPRQRQEEVENKMIDFIRLRPLGTRPVFRRLQQLL